jgi:hypothetical protein
MDKTQINQLESVLESFFNSAAGRRTDVTVEFEPNMDRRGMMYVNGEIGFEDELLYLFEEYGFMIYTVKGVSTGRFEDTKIGVDMKVPDPIPETIE